MCIVISISFVWDWTEALSAKLYPKLSTFFFLSIIKKKKNYTNKLLWPAGWNLFIPNFCSQLWISRFSIHQGFLLHLPCAKPLEKTGGSRVTEILHPWGHAAAWTSLSRQSPYPASSSTGRKGNSSAQGSQHWRFGSQLKKTVLRSPSVRTSAPTLSCRHSQPFYTGTHCHLQSSCSRTMQSNCRTSNNDSRKKKNPKFHAN